MLGLEVRVLTLFAAWKSCLNFVTAVLLALDVPLMRILLSLRMDQAVAVFESLPHCLYV